MATGAIPRDFPGLMGRSGNVATDGVLTNAERTRPRRETARRSTSLKVLQDEAVETVPSDSGLIHVTLNLDPNEVRRGLWLVNMTAQLHYETLDVDDARLSVGTGPRGTSLPNLSLNDGGGGDFLDLSATATVDALLLNGINASFQAPDPPGFGSPTILTLRLFVDATKVG